MDKKRNIVKYVILSCFAFAFVFLTGCNNTSNNIYSILNAGISKVEQTLDNVQPIDVSELILDDFMNENELNEIDINTIDFETESDRLNDYVSKLSLLNNNVYTTIKINDEINDLKNRIINNCGYLKLMLKNSNNCEISNNSQKALRDINKNLMENNTRVSLTRNEINNYLTSVKKLKEQYNKKTDQLNSRYIKLQGALNTRNSYYNNILYCLEQIEYILNDEHDFKIIKNKEKEIKKTWLNKNIDSYENAGNNFFGTPRNVTPYPYNNYNGYPNGYGVGIYNGYGNMYGGYGMGMPPYAYGWGYRMPNINSYWGYRNIDTYKNFRQKELKNNLEDFKSDDEMIQNEVPKINEPIKNPNINLIPNNSIKDNENINSQKVENFKPNRNLKPIPLENEKSEAFD